MYGEILQKIPVWRKIGEPIKKAFVKDTQTERDNYASLILINGVQLVPRDKKNVNVHLVGTECCTVLYISLDLFH